MKAHHDAVSAGDRDEEFEPTDRSGNILQATGTAQQPEDRLEHEEVEPPTPANDGTANTPQGNLSDEARFSLVSSGFFVLGQVPYGMRIVRERQRQLRTNKWATRSRLEPGDRQEVRIVRLIYELYACRNMPVNHILNSLLAQRVPTRQSVATWTLTKIDRILVDPVYIGATHYKGVVRYGAFQPIIEPWIFHAAQSRRCFERLSKSGSLVQQGILELVEGDIDE